MDHRILRMRHELERRQVTVREVSRVRLRITRILFDSDELADFISLGFDEHVKLIIPGDTAELDRRDYTPGVSTGTPGR